MRLDFVLLTIVVLEVLLQKKKLHHINNAHKCNISCNMITISKYSHPYPNL